jgi:hypothetical protein
LEAFRAQLAQWQAQGREFFTAANLADVLDTIGRSRAWLYDQLDALESEGVIAQAGGYPTRWVIRGAA